MTDWLIYVSVSVRRLRSLMNIMSLVAVRKREKEENRKDRSMVDRQEGKKGKIPVCIFESSLGNEPLMSYYFLSVAWPTGVQLVFFFCSSFQ